MVSDATKLTGIRYPAMRSEDTAAGSPWAAAMRRGDFAAAWALSDDVLRRRLAQGERCDDWPRHLQYVWRGQALTGQRVLVRCYHGLGDTIQFIRFAEPLARIARSVVWWVQPALIDLVKTAPGVTHVLPLHDGSPAADYDVDIEVMELPHALRAGREAIAVCDPYLSAQRGAWQRRDRRFAVGLVWQAGDWDGRRSIPAGLLSALAVPDVVLCSLQRDRAAGEASVIPAIEIGTDDVLAAAGRISELDLVISVDTMVAHLAGALGRPVWTLLHADCDWRWGKGADSLWYPTMRLFHQRHPGDWTPVVDQVKAALADLVAPSRPAGRRGKAR